MRSGTNQKKVRTAFEKLHKNMVFPAQNDPSNIHPSTQDRFVILHSGLRNIQEVESAGKLSGVYLFLYWRQSSANLVKKRENPPQPVMCETFWQKKIF